MLRRSVAIKRLLAQNHIQPGRFARKKRLHHDSYRKSEFNGLLKNFIECASSRYAAIHQAELHLHQVEGYA